MSIPGLGQIPTQPVASATRAISLQPGWEWRFEVPTGRALVLKVLSGTAEKDGVELAPRNAYTFSGIKSKILTWHGCELEAEGRCERESVAEYATPLANPANAHVNLHASISALRRSSAQDGRQGPRILISGAANTGKTTLARTLCSYATRQGYQPVFVNADPGDGALTLPGTLSAAVLATVLDPEAADGWGSSPISGPSNVPVKLPLVYYYGRRDPAEDPRLYRELISRLASSVSGRLSDDSSVKSSGIVVDTMGICETEKLSIDLIAHIVEELSVNIIVVIGSSGLYSAVIERFGSEKTSLAESIQVISLEKSDGVAARDESFLEHSKEQLIKEYFFGHSRRALSPQIQQIDLGSLVIFKASDDPEERSGALVREEVSTNLESCTLAMMHATSKDTPETIQTASVVGFVYIANVDVERRKIKILAPVGGRLGDRPMIRGQWPEPYLNLLG